MNTRSEYNPELLVGTSLASGLKYNVFSIQINCISRYIITSCHYHPQASIMTGSALSLGVDGGKSHTETVGQPHLSPLRKTPHLHNDSKNKSTLRMSEKTWESRRIKEEIQDILSPTPLELHKVGRCLVC